MHLMHTAICCQVAEQQQISRQENDDESNVFCIVKLWIIIVCNCIHFFLKIKFLVFYLQFLHRKPTAIYRQVAEQEQISRPQDNILCIVKLLIIIFSAKY